MTYLAIIIANGKYFLGIHTRRGPSHSVGTQTRLPATTMISGRRTSAQAYRYVTTRATRTSATRKLKPLSSFTPSGGSAKTPTMSGTTKQTAGTNDPDSMTASTKHQRTHAASITSVSVLPAYACGVGCVAYWSMEAAVTKGGPLREFAACGQ